MKRLIILAIIMAFIAGVPTTLLAGKGDVDNASQWCAANEDLGFKNHGACVSFVIASSGPGDIGPVISCSELLDYSPQSFYAEYNNLAECVSHLRDGYVVE